MSQDGIPVSPDAVGALKSRSVAIDGDHLDVRIYYNHTFADGIGYEFNLSAVLPLLGDIDGDGSVAFADFLLLSDSFGQFVNPGSNGGF